VLGFTLPPSSRKHRGWWSNNPANNVMTRAWIDAGYQTEEVDIEHRKLVFRSVAPPLSVRETPEGATQTLYGCLRGTVTFVGEADLTQPADPEWGAHEHGDAAG
jgi:hypothetical protein